jgi:hypothetical protein
MPGIDYVDARGAQKRALGCSVVSDCLACLHSDTTAGRNSEVKVTGKKRPKELPQFHCTNTICFCML